MFPAVIENNSNHPEQMRPTKASYTYVVQEANLVIEESLKNIALEGFLHVNKLLLKRIAEMKKNAIVYPDIQDEPDIKG